jgi:hypothetical protein
MQHELDIPDFLKIPQAERAAAWRAWTHRPSTVLGLDTTTAERLALFRARKKEKSRGRVAKMLAVKSDRSALQAGLTWDVKRGGWR